MPAANSVPFIATLGLGAAVVAGLMLGYARSLSRGGAFAWKAEIAGVLMAVAGTLALLSPFVAVHAVGSGDANHYALQAADFAEQRRDGTFPVLVGQSAFAFNGNVHTLRTAPLYVHASGFLDWLAGGSLETFALQNATALLTGLAAVASMWAVIRTLCPGSPVLASWIGLLYLAAPGVAGALLGRDMYATFMVLPWLPLVVLGAAQLAEGEDPRGPFFLLSGAWALTWYAHPPTAILVLPLPVMAALIRLWRGPDRSGFLVTGAFAASFFLLFVAYLGYGVWSLKLGYVLSDRQTGAGNAFQGLSLLWPGLVLPVTPRGGSVSDLQPGYAALALVGVGLMGLRLNPARTGALLLTFLLCALLWIPSRASWALWHSVPEKVMSVVNPWPHQRMMPLVTALACVLATPGLAWIAAKGRAARVVLGCVLALLLGWSVRELRKFQVVDIPAAVELRPENSQLARSSYLLFASFPEYFSHGYMDPTGESRLLDQNFRVRVENGAALLKTGETVVDWTPLDVIVPLQPGKVCALEFRFEQPEAKGELYLASGPMQRIYSLPASGERLAFGSLPAASRTLLVQPGHHDGRELRVWSTLRGVSVRAVLAPPELLPVRVTDLVPFEAVVTNPDAVWLETPRFYVDGYRATVNGQEVPTKRSPQGLVAFRVPSGTSQVRLDHPGPRGLKVVFLLSGTALLVWPVIVYWGYRRGRTKPGTAATAGSVVFAGVLVTVLAVALVLALRRPEPKLREEFELLVDFPVRPRDPAEPLLTVGVAGAADVFYVRYLNGERLVVGYDHWGQGGPVSDPLPYTPGQPARVRISHPAMGRTPHGQAPPSRPVRVVVEGRSVLPEALPAHPADAATITVGENRVGASSCSPQFSGVITPLEPDQGTP